MSKELALPTDRKNKGYELELDSATCTSIHRHAQAHGVLTLLEPHPGRVFCSALAENNNTLLVAAPTTSCVPSTPSAPSALAECDTFYQSNLGDSPQLNLRIPSRKEPLREGNNSLTTNGACRLRSTRNSWTIVSTVTKVSVR